MKFLKQLPQWTRNSRAALFNNEKTEDRNMGDWDLQDHERPREDK